MLLRSLLTGCILDRNHYFDLCVWVRKADYWPNPCKFWSLDLPMTDVPDSDYIQIAFVASLGNSDYSSHSAVISLTQAVPNLCVSRKGFLNYRVN